MFNLETIPYTYVLDHAYIVMIFVLKNELKRYFMWYDNDNRFTL